MEAQYGKDENNMLHEISRIVIPTSKFIDFTTLFVNKEEKNCYLNNAMRDCNVYKFNTWMNMFAAKKHYYYCELGDIYLKLKIEGNYILQVTGSNRNVAFDRIDDILVIQECNGNTEIKIPNAYKYEGLFYTIIEDKQNPVTIKAGAWCTDKEPQRENKLAIVSCTFKREDYITQNISSFENFISQNPQLQDKIKLFIVDNGKTLPESLNSERVTIYPNMNAGGAGGFTRGLMEVMKLNQGYTRVLFMDDDVEMFPESFYRTLILSNYLKNEYKDAFINGAMLDLYNKDMFFENLAIQDKLWVHPLKQDIKLNNYNNILFINDIPTDIFNIQNSTYAGSAWYYHCFDITLVEEKGLPIPCFFRGDDVEWSWRHFGKHHISMNGINIWHSPFIWRVSNVADVYYLARNMFFLNSIYTPNFKKKFKKLFINKYRGLAKINDYVSIELLIKAMKDILTGGEVFKENPEKQFAEINSIRKKTEYLDCNNEAELYYVKDYGKKKVKWFRTVLYFLTHRGEFCPKIFFKRNGIALEWYPPKENFMLTKQVKVYNLFNNKYSVRKFSVRKSIKLRLEFYKVLNEIAKNYDTLHNEYLKAHKEFSTFEFWEKYLEI